jgi:hypothetical protein
MGSLNTSAAMVEYAVPPVTDTAEPRQRKLVHTYAPRGETRRASMPFTHTSRHHAAASQQRSGESHRVLLGLVLAIACLVTVGWWIVLFVLVSSLASAVF